MSKHIHSKFTLGFARSILLLCAVVAVIGAEPTAATVPNQGNNLQKVLVLDEIYVYKTEDSSEDEAYLTVDGVRHWKDDMKAGPVTGYNLNDYVGMIPIGNWPTQIALFDEDGPFDNDDLLGAYIFDRNTPISNGSMHFRNYGADYSIGFSVKTVSNRAVAGTSLKNSGLMSQNGRYFLSIQVDGNLVLYRISDNKVLWATGTNRRGPYLDDLNFLNIQGDGNIVVYDYKSRPLWSSDTFVTPADLVLRDDGSLVIETSGGTLVDILYRGRN